MDGARQSSVSSNPDELTVPVFFRAALGIGDSCGTGPLRNCQVLSLPPTVHDCLDGWIAVLTLPTPDGCVAYATAGCPSMIGEGTFLIL